MPHERREVALPGGLVGHGCGREAVGAPPRPAAFSASSPSRAAGPPSSAPFGNSRPRQRRPGPAQPPHGLRQARPRSAPALAATWPPTLGSRARPVRVRRGPCGTCNSQGGSGAKALSGPGYRRALGWPEHPGGADQASSSRGSWGTCSRENPSLPQPGHIATPVPGSRSHEHFLRNQHARKVGSGEQGWERTEPEVARGLARMLRLVPAGWEPLWRTSLSISTCSR